MPKMKFLEDKYVDGAVAFKKDEVHDIAPSSVERWLKRGGILVEGLSEPPTIQERAEGISREEVLVPAIEIEEADESDDDKDEPVKRGRGRPRNK